ncbi:MAG: prephenate dehydrogenase [Candidatus Omnitrophica bacterium]|jgi:prephenate dehydrogenase|nr:prephenate dehydrogenase [Candidatus Omnitrophota bacterium]
MNNFKNVCIFGTGLIGGSIALGLKRNKLCSYITGISLHQSSIIKAKKLKVIDQGSTNLNIASNADLIILAAPVKTIISQAAKIGRIIKPDCIVIDVGSTKKEVVCALDKIFPGRYIGTHPIAGLEKKGVSYARPDLFQSCLCVFTPTKATSSKVKQQIADLWKKLGAKVVFWDARKHDKILGITSHLPHAIAFSLISCVPREYLPYASGGLKDTTRVAASAENIWADIFLSNPKYLLAGIKEFKKNVANLEQAIQKNGRQKLLRLLKEARLKRESII